MPRKVDATAVDAANRILQNGRGPDTDQLAGAKARSIFEKAMRDGETIEAALGSVYLAGIEDYMKLVRRKKPKSRAPTTNAQELSTTS